MNQDLLDDQPWKHWRDQWSLQEDVVYFNHGSFGPSPRSVQQAAPITRVKKTVIQS